MDEWYLKAFRTFITYQCRQCGESKTIRGVHGAPVCTGRPEKRHVLMSMEPIAR